MTPTEFKCACPCGDPYDCWGRRYGMLSCARIGDDPGPCQCLCHHEWWIETEFEEDQTWRIETEFEEDQP